MRFSLLPQEEKFFDDFNQQADLIVEAASTLRELTEHWDARGDKIKRVHQLEHECDEIVHNVVIRLNKTFVTPIDREDIHGLASALDDVLDFIQGVVVRMELFHIAVPTPQCIELARLCEQSARVIQKGVRILPSFKDITPLRVEMHDFETQADHTYRKALADLFHDGADPLEVIKWKDIYEMIETAVDKCEDVFDVIEAIVLKHA